MTAHILLFEGTDVTPSHSLVDFLQDNGYQVFVASTPNTVAHQVDTLWPNLVLCHVHTTDLPPLQKVSAQAHLEIPWLLVSEDSPPADANKFTLIPRQRLTEKLHQAANPDRFIRLPQLVLDCEQSQVLRDDKTFSLTPKEFRLLHLLLSHPNQVLSRKKIMQQVWDTDYMGDTRTLDVHIRWLREKIEPEPSRPQSLITVRGVGYRFVLDPPP